MRRVGTGAVPEGDSLFVPTPPRTYVGANQYRPFKGLVGFEFGRAVPQI